MRNIFDQYSQPENRLTHAFFSALDRDRKLLGAFLKYLDIKPPRDPNKLQISVQKVPNAPEKISFSDESLGIPDAWIYYDQWAIVFEVKITADLKKIQLIRHRRTAEKYGFEEIRLAAITAKPAADEKHADISIRWKDLFSWIEKQNSSEWPTIVQRYFTVLEAQMIENETLGDAALTQFGGFFENSQDYSYADAKRLLRLSMEELKVSRPLINSLKVAANSPGRGAITGKGPTYVWDYLSFEQIPAEAKFTEYPHLTLAIQGKLTEAAITIPNGLNTAAKNRLKKIKLQGFENICDEILKNFSEVFALEKETAPFIRGIQRRYRSQRDTNPYVDALIEFDLRTMGDWEGPKPQPQWIAASFDAFTNKQSNYQLQIGAKFRYDLCPSMRDKSALKVIEKTWLACKPIIDVLFDQSS